MRFTLADKTARVMRLLIGLRNPYVAGALAARGMTMADVEEVVKMIRDRLLVIGIEPEEDTAVTVCNTTVSADAGRTLDLKALAKTLENTKYNPKQFPGLIYQTEHPKTVILLFDSGKIVCNGGTLEEIQQPLETLMKKLMMEGT
jgi:transcription initiation factor TFIID TATA-box-binding protein